MAGMEGQFDSRQYTDNVEERLHIDGALKSVAEGLRKGEGGEEGFSLFESGLSFIRDTLASNGEVHSALCDHLNELADACKTSSSKSPEKSTTLPHMQMIQIVDVLGEMNVPGNAKEIFSCGTKSRNEDVLEATYRALLKIASRNTGEEGKVALEIVTDSLGSRVSSDDLFLAAFVAAEHFDSSETRAGRDSKRLGIRMIGQSFPAILERVPEIGEHLMGTTPSVASSHAVEFRDFLEPEENQGTLSLKAAALFDLRDMFLEPVHFAEDRPLEEFRKEVVSKVRSDPEALLKIHRLGRPEVLRHAVELYKQDVSDASLGEIELTPLTVSQLAAQVLSDAINFGWKRGDGAFMKECFEVMREDAELKRSGSIFGNYCAVIKQHRREFREDETQEILVTMVDDALQALEQAPNPSAFEVLQSALTALPTSSDRLNPALEDRYDRMLETAASSSGNPFAFLRDLAGLRSAYPCGVADKAINILFNKLNEKTSDPQLKAQKRECILGLKQARGNSSHDDFESASRILGPHRDLRALWNRLLVSYDAFFQLPGPQQF